MDHQLATGTSTYSGRESDGMRAMALPPTTALFEPRIYTQHQGSSPWTLGRGRSCQPQGKGRAAFNARQKDGNTQSSFASFGGSIGEELEAQQATFVARRPRAAGAVDVAGTAKGGPPGRIYPTAWAGRVETCWGQIEALGKCPPHSTLFLNLNAHVEITPRPLTPPCTRTRTNAHRRRRPCHHP